MGQRSVRFPDGLEARALIQAKIVDRSFSYVVVKATEAWLDRLDRLNGTTPIGQGEGLASSRAPVEKEPGGQRSGDTTSVSNPRRSGSVKETAPTESPAPSRPAFKCPVARCEFRAGSPAARCGMHGRTVVPA